MSQPTHDVLIIGAGHNGLVCGAYLAAAGLSVKIVERRNVVGGAAVTEEFHPGFRNSTASYTVSLLNPRIIEDLRLAEHGLRIVERPVANFLPTEDGDALTLHHDLARSQSEVARFSSRDAERLPAYYAALGRVADVLRAQVLKTPPAGDITLGDLLPMLRLGSEWRRLSIETRRDVVDLFTKSAAEVLDRWFENEHVKALFAFDAVVGNYASPYAAGSAYVLLHHVFGEVNGQRGQWGHAIGGMGAITEAMAAEARRRGVEIETGCGVERLLIDDGRATGVRLSDGRELTARAVAANVNPKLLFLDLVDPRELDAEFRSRMQNYRCGSGTLRMNVALSELPDFRARPGTTLQPHHQAGIIIGPTMAYMDRAWRDATEFGYSRAPIIEMLIPSTIDDTLAPRGSHVASLFCQHFAPEGPPGESWDEHREAAADAVIDTVSLFAPNFRDSILGRRVLTPLDLERSFGLVGGDIFHGSLGLDQLFSARPVLGHADYRMPIEGLYLCGSGAHPGGGVTGAPGHNAAHEMIRDLK